MSEEQITMDELIQRIIAEKAKKAEVEPQEISVSERTHLEIWNDKGRAEILAGEEPDEVITFEKGKIVHHHKKEAG